MPFWTKLLQKIQQFKRDFYDQYGVIAPFEAYLGYDIMLFAGRMMKKYGNKFQYHLEKENPQYLHTQFEFERVVDPTATSERKISPSNSLRINSSIFFS
jgi:hypothetical protein